MKIIFNIYKICVSSIFLLFISGCGTIASKMYINEHNEDVLNSKELTYIIPNELIQEQYAPKLVKFDSYKTKKYKDAEHSYDSLFYEFDEENNKLIVYKIRELPLEVAEDHYYIDIKVKKGNINTEVFFKPFKRAYMVKGYLSSGPNKYIDIDSYLRKGRIILSTEYNSEYQLEAVKQSFVRELNASFIENMNKGSFEIDKNNVSIELSPYRSGTKINIVSYISSYENLHGNKINLAKLYRKADMLIQKAINS